jgi:hypothetical protein
LKCHDRDGSGEAVREIHKDIPDFTDPQWQDSRTDADLSRSILEGKGKAMRPMNEKLESLDVMKMVSFIRAFREGKQVVDDNSTQDRSGIRQTTPKTIKPETSSPPRVSQKNTNVPNGGRLFQKFCVKCHEADGSGSVARTISSTIPNFRDQKWQASRSDAQLMAVVFDGKGTVMPAFRGRVSHNDARDLIGFIRATFGSNLHTPESSPTDFEKRYRELEKEFDDLKREQRRQSREDQAPPSSDRQLRNGAKR